MKSSNDGEEGGSEQRRFDQLGRVVDVRADFRVSVLDAAETIAENAEAQPDDVVLLEQRQVVVVELDFRQRRLSQVDLKTATSLNLVLK